MKYPVKITGFGKYVPQLIYSDEIEKQYGLPEGWSEQYSGVRTRHKVSFESNGYMGARALEQAMTSCNIALNQLDMIISASATHDYPIPNSASVIKYELKDHKKYNVPTVDINTTCLSFITAFQFASVLLDGKSFRKIAIVSSEISSIGLNPENWEVLTLFGDGAAAVILDYCVDCDSGFIKSVQKTYTEGLYDTIIKGSGTRHWKDSYNPVLHSFSMNGKNLLRLAKTKMPDFIDEFFSETPYQLADINMIIPHQASKIGLKMFLKQYTLPESTIHETLYKYGNCIAASIPLTLIDAIEAGKIKRGDICLMLGTSAGFSIGGALIKY